MAIAFDAIAVSSHYGVASNSATFTCGLTVGGGANNCTFIDVIVENAGSQNFAPNVTTPPVVTMGGVTFTSMGSVLFNNAVNGGWTWRFVGFGVPSGAQTASAQITDSGHTMAAAFIVVTTYTGVASVGSLVTAFGTFTPAISVSSATGRVVCVTFGSYNVAAPWSSPTGFTAEVTQNATGTPFVVGDAAGAGTVNMSATHGAGYPWGALACEMLPAAAGTVIQPGPAIIALAGLPPTLTATANKTLQPGAGAVALAGSAPTVSVSNNIKLTPGAGNVGLRGFPPTVTATANVKLTPGASPVVVLGYPPTVTATAGVRITPGPALVALTGSAPSVVTSGNKLFVPSAGPIALVGYPPTVLTPRLIIPATGVLALAGSAPTVTVTANKVIQPGPAVIALRGSAPSIVTTSSAFITPGPAVLAMRGFPPTLGSNKVITPGGAATPIAVTGFAPTLTISAVPENFVDYGYCQSEMCWGNASPVPMSEAKQRSIMQGIREVGGSRVRIAVQVGTWADLDLTVGLAVEYGIKPLLCILGNETLQPYSQSDVASFASLCKALALRYGPSGKNQVSDYELFNESNNVFFNPPKQQAAGHAAFLKAGYTAIKAVQPSSFVMSGGTVPVYDVAFGWAQNPVDWYRILYASGCRDYMDGIGFHLYVEETPGPAVRQWKYMLDIRDLMVAQGDGAKKIFVTEVGTSYPGPGIPNTIIERDWLKTMVDAIIAYPWCSQFYIYNFQNSQDNINDSGSSNYGIRTFAGAPKEPKWSYCKTISSTPANPGDITPPSEPLNFSVTGITTDTAISTWIPSTDDVGVTVYKVYDDATGLVLGQTTEIGQVSLLLENLTPSTEITAYATAFDAAGHESEPSNTFTFHTAAPVGVQQIYTYDMASSPSVPLVFTQLDDGFHVTSGAAVPNTPTVDKHYLSCQPYSLALQTPDHYVEIEVDTASLSADRAAIGWLRVSADGKQRVGVKISGGGQVDACEIFTYVDGEVKVRAAINATALLGGGVEKLRGTADGSTYTVSRVKDGTVTDLGQPWVDVNSEYPGSTNVLTAIGWEYLRVRGVYYPPPGITKFHAADLRAVQPSSGGAGGASWTFAIVKPSSRGLVKASQRWQTSLK